MNADEARDRFADAIEGTLGADKKAFEAALAADEELDGEYRLYQQLLGGTRALGNEEAADAQPPALLPAVQRKIRVRSKGRFFRDRFSSETGGSSFGKNTLTLVLAMVVLLLVAITIVVVQDLVVVELPHSRPAPSSDVTP